ncbi:MAG TPA: hypothetical protein PLE45_07405 [Spirochaetota bacterium]|nr:hypothetical protein [Spirochaetota bacterium]HPP05176.1 hypothetical protein [Spirochaetota bacterium]
MKCRLIIAILLSISIYLNSIPKKDYFSVVFISNNKNLEIFDNVYNKNIIATIPAGFENLKTTWRTTREKKRYYIEIKYEDKTGWVDRAFLTRGFDHITEKNQKEIDKLLLNLTASIQQKDGNRFIKSFYSLKGFSIYLNNRFYYIDYNDIIDSFYRSLSDKNFEFYGILEKMLLIFEKRFDIYYNEKNEEINNIIELKNFQTITLIYKEKKLIICLEKIMEKFYITGFIILY